MKIKWGFIFLAGLMASTLYARPDNSRLLYFPLPIQVNGAEVPKGIYQLTWETHESSANITLTKDGNFIAGGKGTWVKQGTKYSENAVLLRVNEDGSRSLTEIRLAGSKKTIVFADPTVDVSSSKLQHLKASID